MKLFNPDIKPRDNGRYTPVMVESPTGKFITLKKHLKRCEKRGISSAAANSIDLHHLVLEIRPRGETTAYWATTGISEYGKWVLVSDSKAMTKNQKLVAA